MLHLILVRHGETEWNAQRRYQGQSDVPLSDVGRKQAKLLARRLARVKFDALYASDLKRAWETASIIRDNIGVEITPELRLREMNFGIIEGLTFDEAQARYPDVVAAWLKDYNQPPPNGETLSAFSVRLLSLLDDLQKKHVRFTQQQGLPGLRRTQIAVVRWIGLYSSFSRSFTSSRQRYTCCRFSSSFA